MTFYYHKISDILYNIIWIKENIFEAINSCDHSEELMSNIVTSVRGVPADGLVIVKCYWVRVMYICVGNLSIIGSDDGLSPDGRQAIIWTNARILLIGPLGTIFSEILFEIHIFSFTKLHLKIPSVKWRTFCLGLNVLSVLSYLNWLHSWLVTAAEA